MDLIENTTWVNGGKARRTLRELPSNVNEAYEKILGRGSDPDTARRILHLVMAAARPLDLNQLALALAVNHPDQSDEDIEDAMEPPERSRHTFKDVCGCLLTIIDDKVYLLHQTVKRIFGAPVIIVSSNFDFKNLALLSSSNGITPFPGKSLHTCSSRGGKFTPRLS